MLLECRIQDELLSTASLGVVLGGIFESGLVVDAPGDKAHAAPDRHRDEASCLGAAEDFDLVVDDVFERTGAVAGVASAP